jgi:hypothetical protein
MSDANCDACKSTRVFSISCKASDRHGWSFEDRSGDGYAPAVTNVCGGDYMELAVCLTCGKTQGKFPVGDPVK